jgi:hypothetical protein
LNTIANVKEFITEFPCPIISTSTVHAQNDTLPENNSKEAIIYILGDIIHLPDVSVRQSIAVDSFETIDAVSLPVVVQDATYPITIQLSNWSLIDGENVTLSYIVDDSMEIIGANPSPDMYSPDSVVWRFARLESNHSLRFSVDVLLAEIMPVSRNLLHNKAYVSAENEKAAQRDNNQSILTMVNYGVVVEPFEPILEVSPEIASVSDSIRIRVFFPVEIVDWDLWIYLPTGEILTDFADIFIETTVIEPGRWYDIDLPYLHRTLLGDGSSNDILFELRATGKFNSSGIAQHHIMVNLDFDLVPPNVIPPGSADIPIDFVVSSGHVEMKLYDVAGRHIADLVDENFQAGRHTLVWNGMTENGQLVGSGVYLITLRTEEANTWKKLIIVR